VEDISEIDVFKSLLPSEDQKRLTVAAENGHDAPPGAVDWKILQQATRCAWNWMLREMLVIARDEGYRDFMKSRANQVRSFLDRRSFQTEPNMV
jgi:hypothetical protein